MKKTVYFILIIGMLFSCDNESVPNCFKSVGKTVQQEREVVTFSKILVNEGISLIIKQGNEYTVIIESGENLINDIQVKIEEGRLILTNNNNCNFFRSYENTTAFVTVPNLTEIRSSTQFDIHSEGVLNFENLTIISEDFLDTSLQSVGNFYLNIQCRNLKVVFNNLSNAFIEGTVEEVDIEFQSGNGRFEAENLIIDNAAVFHRGTNDIILNTTNSLIGDIFSTGNIISVTRPDQVEVIEHYRGRLIYKD
ncbi:head GIN domain-containing protein [Ascidiimonas sp. W6]|uniref:head GIN domain-containing protein n=1 Tax=Ascidiimonas meishanensis TaxID=3128903 RepID=UPI0030EF1BD6